ncbi:hypothetical protein OVA24_12115 [Luteolibacter sp. SL250]|uniref:hypothetical protein n=1 Tax=Luteolibacter sp. SL250 TaxID=2995170 RepID=UPI00226DD46F|nr:hypothetical protein [Luteolibacter sp. SL250]WAC17983.1 hypothetical protein OVA24_12115 [Luteolibacter sp. SL250]
MKRIPSLAIAVLGLAGGLSSAANLMLDFGPTAVGSDYQTLSPGHNSGTVPTSQVTWNQISSTTPPSLFYGDGTAAAALTLTMGQESTPGSNTVDFFTPITNQALAGTGGGTAGRQNLLTTGSIYGNNSSSTAVSRDGFFGGGTGSVGSAVGLRVDGLASGQYLIYVMARNTNSNASPGAAMNIYANTAEVSGESGGSFDFSSLSAFSQSNITYATSGYTDQYTHFVNGGNYVVIDITIADNTSLFLAVDGTGSENRGFLNMVQIVQVPEPASAFLGAAGFLLFLRRRK